MSAGPRDPKAMWNSRYAEEGFAYGDEPNAWVKEASARLSVAGTLAELASGEGRNAVFLAKAGHTVFAVDFAAEGVRKTAELAAREGVSDRVHAVEGDATSWLPPAGLGSLDAVVGVFLHLPKPVRPALWQHVMDLVRPGGVFLAELYTPDQVHKAYKTGGPPVADMCIGADELRDAFASAGSFDVLEELEYEVHEGKYHNGMGAVVRVLWRKA